jgi:hypothetical protein
MLPAKYETASAFRQALEARLMTLSRFEGVDIQRLRRQVSFDRLLARLFNHAAGTWALKGGYAMELRLATARTTRDIDLTLIQLIAGDEKERMERILEMLQAAAAIDLADAFIFLVGEPVLDLDAAPYGGGRFPVEARMDGRIFAKFHLDIGIGDIVMAPLDYVRSRNWLEFADIPAAAFPAISPEQQFAEKYHAYTLPRSGRENSRVRDLVDMLLLIRTATMKEEKITEALKLTFSRRGTHKFPEKTPPPPPSWAKPFAALAAECGLNEAIDSGFDALRKFIQSLSEIY